MNSNAAKVAIGVGAIAVAVVLLVVLKSGNSDESSKTSNSGGKVPVIAVDKSGKPVGGIRALTYNEGEQVRFEVKSGVSDEVHVHGYDIMKDVEAGGTIGFDFPASLEGVFEAELEGRKEQIIELTVNP
jgi:hypothetical protein